MPNRASSYPVTSSYPIISKFGFAELCLWENFISFSIHLENSEIEFVITERTCHLINQTLWMTIYPQPEQFLIILFCWKVLNFDNTPKQYHQTTISKKAMYLSFYSKMFIHIFFLGLQRSVGLPDVHSGYGFAIDKLQSTHLW